MSAYYNEIDPFAAEWLRQLIKAGLIAPGDIDTRSIEDVTPADLAEYSQCHFFAGIGVWPYALRRAGWPDDRPVWTGSCPCQPFSQAGTGKGFADERHLWPAFYWLISQCRPPIIFGEQVASPDGLAWLDLVSADVERTGYAFGAADLCAAGIGAPHIRQRLYWVADADGAGLERWRTLPECPSELATWTGSVVSGLAESNSHRRASGGERGASVGYGQAAESDRGAVAVADRNRPGPTNGYWRDADWISCRDDKWRPVEPGASPLADGVAAHVGRLRGYGNSINAEVAKTFVEAFGA